MPKPKLDPLLLPAWKHFEWLIGKIPPLSPKPHERRILAVLRQMQEDLERGEIEPVITYFEDMLAESPDTNKEGSAFEKARNELFGDEYTSMLGTLQAYRERKDPRRPPH